MTRLRIISAAAVLAVLAGLAAWWLTRTRPVTTQDLQGEWVQDPEFLQNPGEDLVSQRKEVEQYENYQFAFSGSKLTGYRMIHDEGKTDSLGWSVGKGVSFESDYALAPARNATLLKFQDHTKAAREAQLAWEKDKLTVALGERKFRLMKGKAEQLRARKLIAAP
jgi:hypothetical protein